MKNITSILNIVLFGIAAIVAITSHAGPEQSYSRKVDVPGQTAICQARIGCDDAGTYPCTIFLNGITVQLYRRTSTAPVVCETPIYRFE